VISDEDLASIRSEAADLLGEVQESDCPEELRGFLVETIWALLDALDDYLVSGLEPLRRAYAQAVGSAELLSDETKSAGLDDPMVKKTRGLLGQVAVFLSIGSSAAQLATTILALSAPHIR
jgi:hypothetical protein